MGQTKRSLQDRIKEHGSGNNTESVISLHMTSFNHNFHWEKTTILDIERNYQKRLISKMLFINSFNNTLNKIEGTHKLNNTYKCIKLNSC